MVEQSTIKATVSCVVAVMLFIGFTAAPAAALTQDSVIDDDIVDIDGIDADTTSSGSTTSGGANVRIVETNSPVQTGETLEVTADIEAESGGSAELLIDGTVEDETTVPQGFDGRKTLTWETTYSDAGEHNATVRSGGDTDTETVQVEAGQDAPEQLCTNVPKRVNENVPYEELPSTDELPEEVPNPVPPFVGPRAVTNLVVGAAPNQCEIQDPNDPSVDPTDPPTNPDATVNVLRMEQNGDGGAIWITYEATLDQAADGPSVSGSLSGIANSGGVAGNPDVTLNDGQKDYTVDPAFNGDTSTAEGSTEVRAPFGNVGGNIECAGGECQPGSSGIPTFAEYPAVPAPIWSGEE